MKRLSGVILTLLFVSYYAGNTLFPHVHNDGINRPVVHSHPFAGKSSSPGHTHSSVEIQAIALLSVMAIALLAASAGIAKAARFIRNIVTPAITHLCFGPEHHFGLRAPPACA